MNSSKEYSSKRALELNLMAKDSVKISDKALLVIQSQLVINVDLLYLRSN